MVALTSRVRCNFCSPLKTPCFETSPNVRFSRFFPVLRIMALHDPLRKSFDLRVAVGCGDSNVGKWTQQWDNGHTPSWNPKAHQFKMDGWKGWFPTISYIEIWFIIQLKQPFRIYVVVWGSRLKLTNRPCNRHHPFSGAMAVSFREAMFLVASRIQLLLKNIN